MSQAVAGSGSNRSDKSANADPIQDFIKTAAIHIRKTELFYGWMILLSTLLFSTFLFVLIDHWIWEFNQPMRLALWIGLVLWSIWWFIRRILPPMRFKIHPEYAARQFELQDPRSKDSLISWIQLNDPTHPAPKSVLNFVGRYAFGFLRNSDATQVADTGNLVRLTAAFFGCLLCTLIYFFASPKSGLTSTARMLMPWANIAPATRVQFTQVTPASTTIMQGSSIPIDVTIKGLHKNEKVYLQYDLSDGQLRGQTVPMKEEIQGINYKLDFGKDSGGLHQPLTYWIHAGDAVAGPFDVQIQIVPLVAIDRIELVFPPYTNLKPRSIQQQGHFEAPEGTLAHIHAVANQEMQSAKIEFDPVLQNKLFLGARETLDMKVDKTQLDASWIAIIDRKNSIERKITNYRIHAINSLKESNHDPIIHKIKIIPDIPPEIEFSANSNVAVDVPVDQGILLEMTARDPDYGLTSVDIQGVTENKLNPQEPKIRFQTPLFEANEESPRTKISQYTFLPLEHQLKPGDEIDLIATAADNHHNPTSQKLEPQRASSQPIRIRIVEPESKSDTPQTPKDPETPTQDPAIASAENPMPKSRIDWDRFRTKPQQNASKSPPQTNANSPDNQNPSDRNGNAPPPPGIGASSDSNQKAQPADNPSNSQPSPSNSNPNATPNPDQERNENLEQAPNGSSKQDQNAFEKIQQFMKEQQQSDSNGSNNSQSPPSSNTPPYPQKTQTDQSGTDKTGTDKTGTDKTGSDKAGSDKAGTDKTGSDKAGTDKTGTDKTGTDKTGTDKAGTDKAGTDKAGTDKTGTDKTGTDKTGTDKTGTDKTGTDKAGTDKAGTDKAGTDKAGTDKAGSDKTGNDKTGNDKTGNDKTGNDKTGNDKTGNDKTGNDKTGNDKTGTDKTGTDKSGTDKAGTDKAGTDKAGTDKAGTDKAGTDKAGTDKAGTDKAGTDKAGTDKAGTDKAGTDKAGADKAGTDKAGTDKAGTDKAGSDKTGTDKAGTDKAGTDKAGTDKAGTDKAGTDKAGTDKAGTDKAGTDKAGTDKAGTDKAGADKAGTDKAGTDKAGTDKAGTDKAGSDKAGESGKDGKGQKSNGNPDQGPESMPKQEQGDGQGSGDEQGDKQGPPKSSAPSSAGSGMNTSGKTPQAGGSSATQGSQSDTVGADRANEAYSSKAADMLLEYIDRQKDQPDPELLKKLNWNAEDFRKFADRWQEAKEQAKSDPTKRAELEETLRNLGLGGTGRKINRLKDRNDGIRGMQEEGGRLRPPESLREQFEAFRKAAGKLGK
jgi:collagen type III alpha